MPLSRQALENKRNYNKEYVKQYRKDNNLVAFTTYIPKDINFEILSLLKQNNLNKKDFVLSAYEALTKEYFIVEKH